MTLKKTAVIVVSLAVVSASFISLYSFLVPAESYNFKFTQGVFGNGVFKRLSAKPVPQITKVTMIAVGDIMLSRDVERKIKQTGNFTFPFLKIKDYLSTGDIVFGNLESPITTGREVAAGEMVFRAPVGAGLGLKQAGFTILSLANNHTPNFGGTGLIDTFNDITKAGLIYVGAGKSEDEAYAPVFLDKNGFRFAFLAYNDSDTVPTSYKAGANHAGTAIMDGALLALGISEAKKSADFVIVSMHSGTEYATKPNSRQVEFARSAIDSGADLVIGHHPHVIQNIEKYKDKYIFYSLGNFVFDQLFSTQTRKGLVAKITFNEDKIEKIETIKVFINSSLQPEIQEGKGDNITL